MRRVKVKICGITRLEDLEAACSLGADAVGFIVDVSESPRNLSPEVAEELIAKVPIFVKSVIVTALNDPNRIVNLYERLKPDVIQVHGGTPEDILALRKRLPKARLIGALPVKSGSEIEKAAVFASFLDAVLVDSYVAGRLGGTGVTHDWSISARIREMLHPKPLILAGGLNPENIKEAVRIVKPYAVDVSTGVEAHPGLKDPEKIKAFIEEAKSVLIQD
ncbi:phosphoribosylanthranilate isomerase [Candidatus Bathyarchaeota archaeon]|nr:phosphoribosylanthranilate isomerase [Candidatus Bathyarchaeota archaeon]